MTIQQKIEKIAAEYDGRIALSILNLQTNQTVNYRADEVFRTASVIKLAVLATFMSQIEAGEASLADPLMLRRADVTDGSGVLQHLSPGLIMPARDYAFLMMNISDNLATNVLIDYVGLENVRAYMTGADYPNIQLRRKLIPGLPNEPLGTATPAELTRLMTAVFRRQIISPRRLRRDDADDGWGGSGSGRSLPALFPVWRLWFGQA